MHCALIGRAVRPQICGQTRSSCFTFRRSFVPLLSAVSILAGKSHFFQYTEATQRAYSIEASTASMMKGIDFFLDRLYWIISFVF